MKYIYLLRHAEAEKNDYFHGKDAERRLTSGGKHQLRAAAHGMKKLGVNPEIVLSSPLARARETAEIVAEELKVAAPVMECLTLAPGHHPSELIRYLERHQDFHSILLVGHEPNMGHLLSTLVDRTGHSHIIFEKAGLGLIEVEGALHPGKGVLHWLLTPEQLCLKAK